jgi:SAM-dependent methyltransferase
VAVPTDFTANRVRGPLNAVTFSVLDGYLNWLLAPHKRHVFANLPDEIVELGSGVGANFRYLRPGTRVIAVEPNPAMHARLRKRAAKYQIELTLIGITGERLDIADESADAVISSLVLCTVADPAAVIAQVMRVLRPGGRYAFVEHVVAAPGTVTRKAQRLVRRPWAWCFEGCSCERDLASAIEGGAFGAVDLERYRLRTPLIPFNTHIAGVATKAG